MLTERSFHRVAAVTAHVCITLSSASTRISKYVGTENLVETVTETGLLVRLQQPYGTIFQLKQRQAKRSSPIEGSGLNVRCRRCLVFDVAMFVSVLVSVCTFICFTVLY